MQNRMNPEIPHPLTHLWDLSYSVSDELIFLLESNGAWRMVAQEFAQMMIDPRNLSDQLLERNNSPARSLWEEIKIRGCTVEVLAEILERCQLYDALALLRPPERVEITQQPADGNDDYYVCLGDEFRLSCGAFGLPPPQYIWLHENEELTDQQSSTLCIPEFTLEHEGNYSCCVRQYIDGEIVEVFSNEVEVKCLPQPPHITGEPEQFVLCSAGDDVEISFGVDGYPDPEFQWYKGNCLLDGQTSADLIITSVTSDDEGLYTCEVRNVAGEVITRPVKLTVIEAPADDSERLIAKEKVALLIGNTTYDQLTHLRTPANDVETLALLLTVLGFKVIALWNLTLVEMKHALEEFCKLLPEKGYGLFYFAGHGFEIHDKYMLPVDAPSFNSFKRTDSLCEKQVIRDLLQKRPQLLVIILDMCLKVPNRKENKDIHKELAEVFEYRPERNLIQAYATTSNLGAYERAKERNGIYMNYLKQHIKEDLDIMSLLSKVHKLIGDLETPEAAGKQIPSIANNTTKKFRLTDSIEGDDHTDEIFRNFVGLPSTQQINFRKMNLSALIKYRPHKQVILNSLDIIFESVHPWHLTFEDPHCVVTLELERKEGDYVLSIHNLQKIKSPLTISVFLLDSQGNKIDNDVLSLGLPLIASCCLWFQNPAT